MYFVIKIRRHFVFVVFHFGHSKSKTNDLIFKYKVIQYFCHLLIKSLVTASIGSTYFFTVWSCKMGFCTLVLKVFHGSPCLKKKIKYHPWASSLKIHRFTYTPTTPPSLPKNSFLTSLLYFTKHGMDGLNGVGPSCLKSLISTNILLRKQFQFTYKLFRFHLHRRETTSRVFPLIQITSRFCRTPCKTTTTIWQRPTHRTVQRAAKASRYFPESVSVWDRALLSKVWRSTDDPWSYWLWVFPSLHIKWNDFLQMTLSPKIFWWFSCCAANLCV